VSRAPKVLESMANLPLRALYPLTALAKASTMDRRTLRAVLERAGVELFVTHTSVWVPLSELELKVRPLWESIKAAEMLRQLVDEET
jgi:hypothetical protein